jgi:hypothetical protein
MGWAGHALWMIDAAMFGVLAALPVVPQMQLFGAQVRFGRRKGWTRALAKSVACSERDSGQVVLICQFVFQVKLNPYRSPRMDVVRIFQP